MAADWGHVDAEPSSCLQYFKLFETRSKFYMIGRNKSKTVWRVLKIDRAEPSELNIFEDSTNYTESDCYDLLKRINEGNMSSGGLRRVTNFYGIIGFVKFLGPYYMLLITERRKIGVICGHAIYAISKSKMISLSNSNMQPSLANSKAENRYKKLLCTVDLTKDFFFSYSYHIMCSLQKNLCGGETGSVLYETMFVWNEYLTRGFRNHLNNTTWTVALVYGFFRQVKLTVSGKEFILTLIARRSRHFAGTRYLKRGVNEKGRVANDVETEQIVFEDNDREIPSQISSVVQHRGSIPLFWSQESSWLNMRPDIILHKDQNYEATRLHFDNLVKRYGNPIIILNLIKTREKKPRETILRAEFAKAIDYINKSLPKDHHLKFLHWDIQKYSRMKSSNVLDLLGRVAAYALKSTGFFYCQVPPNLRVQGALVLHILPEDVNNQYGKTPCAVKFQKDFIDNFNPPIDESLQNEMQNDRNFCMKPHGAIGFNQDFTDNSGGYVKKSLQDDTQNDGNFCMKPPKFQKGVLRTNCIDCLDRTNVAQYAYGLIALAHQLHTLGIIDVPKIDLNTPVADDLMHLYERMGDTLSLQYGGSAAHNKIFSERRGQWKAATHSQELFRTLQRYYSNTYMDAEKQDAINVFLGHFQPQHGRPALWELDSDQHYNIGRRGFSEENSRSFIKRSLSDGNILCQDNVPVPSCNVGNGALESSLLRVDVHKEAESHSDSGPEISTCEVSYSSCTPMISMGYHTTDIEDNYFKGLKLDESNCSNFLDLDWISSSGNSCEENYERSSLINSPVETLSTEDVTDCSIPGATQDPIIHNIEQASNAANRASVGKFSQRFADWVAHGEAFCC